MPSCQLFVQSGGIALVSGNIFSGTYGIYGPFPFPVGGIQLKLARGAPGPCYVGLPPIGYLSGFTSGVSVTQTSGGSLSSGGMMDGVEMQPNDSYFIPRLRLNSGLASIQVAVPAASSGGVLFWEIM